MPEETFEFLLGWYNKARRGKKEAWPSDNTYFNHWKYDTTMFNAPHSVQKVSVYSCCFWHVAAFVVLSVCECRYESMPERLQYRR